MIIKGGEGWGGVGIVRWARHRRGGESKSRSGVPLGRRGSRTHGIGWRSIVLLRMLGPSKIESVLIMVWRGGALRVIIPRARHRRGLEIMRRRGNALRRRGSESHGVRE